MHTDGWKTFLQGFKCARKGENNIQMSLKVIGCDSWKHIRLAQDGVKFDSNFIEPWQVL
jgi:hypothetical protein